jgi:hypothetical protein
MPVPGVRVVEDYERNSHDGRLFGVMIAYRCTGPNRVALVANVEMHFHYPWWTGVDVSNEFAP